MNANVIKVSTILIAAMVLMPIGIFVLSGSASPVYENDGEEHFIASCNLPEGSIDGLVGTEWPASSEVGSLWCTSESEPVGKIFMVHDNGMLFIGAKVTYPASLMADDGHWIKIDWDRDSSMEIDDNMGNTGVEFACCDLGFEYAIPMSQELIENDRFNLLLHAEMLGLPSDPEGETTTFPFREPGPFFSTTMVLEYPAPNAPPIAMMEHYSEDLTVYLDGSSSYDADGCIDSFYWEFGDGLNSNGELTEHSYESPGQYQIKLTVMDNGGFFGYATERIDITVPEPEPPEPIEEPITEPIEEPITEPIEEPITEPEFTGPPHLTYTIEYFNYLDYTTVSSQGILFYSSGSMPGMEELIPFNNTYVIPEEDYGTYPLYNSCNPLQFRIHITNHDPVAHTNIQVTATQETHNTLILWDACGELQMIQGEPLAGTPEQWTVDIDADGDTVLTGFHAFSGRGFGLDQTHVIISHNGITLFDDPEAGVYCPP